MNLLQIQIGLDQQLFLGLRRYYMSKKTQNYSKNCFKIKGRQDLFIKDQILVSFAPYRKTKNIKHTSILPTFNHDRKYYTFAFSLPSASVQPEVTLKQQHDNRAKQAQIQLEQIWCPKPRSRHKYCGVCRDYYQDYKQHTQGEKHLQKLKNSQYQKLINQLANQIQQKLAMIQEQPNMIESSSQDQIFKCLSAQTLVGIDRRLENVPVQ